MVHLVRSRQRALSRSVDPLSFKPGFDDMFSSCGKEEHVEMCTCGFVFQQYGKSTYDFRIFRHLSCSICIILTYSLENEERGQADGSNLLFVY